MFAMRSSLSWLLISCLGLLLFGLGMPVLGTATDTGVGMSMGILKEELQKPINQTSTLIRRAPLHPQWDRFANWLNAELLKLPSAFQNRLPAPQSGRSTQQSIQPNPHIFGMVYGVAPRPNSLQVKVLKDKSDISGRRVFKRGTLHLPLREGQWGFEQGPEVPIQMLQQSMAPASRVAPFTWMDLKRQSNAITPVDLYNRIKQQMLNLVIERGDIISLTLQFTMAPINPRIPPRSFYYLLTYMPIRSGPGHRTGEKHIYIPLSG